MNIRHLRALLFRHGMVQKQIDAEQSAPRPDPFRLLRLKRLRLSLKDRMHRLTEGFTKDARQIVVPIQTARRQPFRSSLSRTGGAS